MAKIRRKFRKRETGAEAPFDEQVWPVNVALLVLGAYLAGIILAVFPLNHPNLLLNAITWVSLVVVGIPLIMWGLWYVDNNTLRRGVQLAAILSLIINLTVMVFLAMFDLIPVPEIVAPATKDPLVQRQPVVIPDYHPSQLETRDRPKQDFERPVETETPEPTEEEVPHRETSPKDPETRPEPTPVPEPNTSVRPNPTERAEMAESAPRRSDQLAKRSRQTAQAQPRPATPATAEPVPTQAEQRPTPLKAQATQVERRAAQMQVRQRTVDVEPSVERPHDTLRLARRETETAPQPQSTSTPTLTRQVEAPQMVPRTSTRATAEEAPAVARRTSPDALRPSDTSAARQVATSTVAASRTTIEPVPQTPTTGSQQVVSRRHQASPAPTIVQMPTPVVARRDRSFVRPNVSTTAAATEATRAPTQSSSPQLSPSTATVARQAARVAATANPTSAPAEAPSAGTQMQMARAATRRAAVSAVPTINPSASPTRSPARSTREAPTAVSPAAVASAMAVASDSPASRPTPRPARTALSKSVIGMAGIGRSANLDRALPANDQRSAMVASGSAQRRRATQNMPRGPSIEPRSLARISRSRSGADAPSATLRAQNVEMPTAAGAQRTGELEASASAAMTEAGADAPEAATTASQGTVEVDFGPTQVVPNTGVGSRAAGGGMPVLNFQVQTRRIARRGVGSGPTIPLAANTVAEQPGAPVGEGGGAPSVLQANVQATAATRTDTGGNVPASGGPSSAEQTGPPELVSSASLTGRAEIGRAELAMAAPGVPTAGAGTGSPTRTASGPISPANTRAETVMVTGQPQSSGEEDGLPLAAQGTELERAATGLVAPATDAEFGAIAGEQVVDAATVAQAGRATGVRRASPGRDPGPVVADISYAGGPLRRAPTTGLPMGDATAEQIPVPGASGVEAQPDAVALAGGLDLVGIDRQAVGAIPVSVDALDGPGGIESDATPNVGLTLRRAQAESTEVHLRSARFIRKQSGGLPGINVTASVGADAFARRATRKGDETGGEPGRPSEKTEEAIELGLHFLARHQSADGSWTLNDFGTAQPQFAEEYVDEKAGLKSDSAATGLALMAFFGAGYHHKDDKYADVIGNALDFLLNNQVQSPDPMKDGDLYLALDDESNRSVWLYSHGIATIALCEAYGMTQDPELREPAQRAIQFILQAQHPSRGGWRYSPQTGSDTSVTGWLMMALMSGRLANLDVPDEAFQKIEGWLDKAQATGGERHLYRYNPFAPDTVRQRHGRRPNETMTAVGLLMRLYLGWRRDKQYMIEGADYLMENLPAIGTRRSPERDTYYWYYATQVMFHMKGKYWEAWNNRLHPLLVNAQIKDGTFAGSWDPRRPVPDRWSPHAGRMYVTTMNLLSLEVYYRHMPIYQEETLD